MSDFVHLHTHSDNSPLDGMSSVAQIVAAAAADGQRAVAVTDHGNLAGTLELARAASSAGIKAIGGMEMYLAVGDRFDTKKRFISYDEFEGEKSRPNHHLTVLAGSQTGWTNLVKINNAAMHSVVSKPRADIELLHQHGDGLILGTGCLGGPVQQELINGDPDTAMDRAKTAVERLLYVVDGDKDRLFVEVMDHGIDVEAKALPQLVELAQHFGLRIAATNDSHYCGPDDTHFHDALLAVGTKAKLTDEKRFRFKGNGGYWVKTTEQMRQVFPDLLGGQDVIANAGLIADMVDGDLIDFMPTNRVRLPKFPIPDSIVADFNAGAPGSANCANAAQYYLFRKVYDGAVSRFGSPLPEVVKNRLRFELDVMNGFNFEDYFLVVSWITDRCHSEGYVHGAGRGSAAGSLAAYCLRITDVDPLAHNLLFERFLDVFRKGYPDVDLDFPKSTEQQVMGWLREQFGERNVARIGTFSTKKARAILEDVGRISNYTSEAVAMKEALPVRNPHNLSLVEYLRPDTIDTSDPENTKAAARYEAAKIEGAELRKLVSKGTEAEMLVKSTIAKYASRLEGVRGGFGIHACGIVVSDDPLDELIPLRIDAKKGDVVSYWTGPDLESLGFVKMDALTIDNLDVVVRALDAIKSSTGEVVDTSYGNLPMDASDPRAAKAWEIICRGDTAGLFQIEGSGITQVAMDVAPNKLDDLSAVVALYRPGPMAAGMPKRFAARKNGREAATYDYLTTIPAEQAALGTVLDKSYGVIVVQEDLMNLSKVVSGFGPGRRNRLRKAFSKKIKDEMDDLHDDFINGGLSATTHDVDGDWEESIPFVRSTLDELWRTFEASAEYLFNACVPADTELMTGRGVGPKAERWTVGRLYQRLHGDRNVPDGMCVHCGERAASSRTRRCGRCSSWLTKFNDGRGFTLLSYDRSDGRIRPQRVKDVHYNGAREVYRIVCSDGRVIRSTSNHRWLTTDGYRRVDQFDAGTLLVTHEGYEPQHREPKDRTTRGDRRSAPGKPWLEGRANCGYVDGGFIRLMEWTSNTTPVCDECGMTPDLGRLERAHLDGDRSNNAPSNLAWKCVSHHKAYDYRVNNRPARWSKGHLTGTCSIDSIELDGIEDVYDVEMADGTDHNFVADGVVSHNSHSAPYAYLAYIEAYLKANYPAYFGAALLSVKEDINDRLNALNSLRRTGVTVLGPDLNESGLHTQAVDLSTIRLGLSEIRGVRSNAQAVIAERDANGPFSSLHDLVTRVSEEVTRKTKVKDTEGSVIEEVVTTSEQMLSMATVDSLIDSGACDTFGHPRRGMSVAARAMRMAPDVSVPDTEYGPLERAVRERRGLGIVISEHPVRLLQSHDAELVAGNRQPPVKIARLKPSQSEVCMDVVVAHCLTKRGQSGKRRAHLVLEDDSASTDAIMWSQALEGFRTLHGRDPKEGDIVTVGVRVKTMLVLAGDADPDAEHGAMEEQRMDVVVNTMDLRDDAADDEIRDVPHQVAHPLTLVTKPPQEAEPSATEPVVVKPPKIVVKADNQYLIAGHKVTIRIPSDWWKRSIRLKEWLPSTTDLDVDTIHLILSEVRSNQFRPSVSVGTVTVEKAREVKEPTVEFTEAA